MQGGNDLSAQQLDGAHHILVSHSPFVSVYMYVTGAQPLNNLGQFPDDCVRAADDDVGWGAGEPTSLIPRDRKGFEGPEGDAWLIF